MGRYIFTLLFRKVNLLCVLVLFLFDCTSKKNSSISYPEDKRYLFLSHTRLNVNPEIDSNAAKIDLDRFDMLLLGGDLAQLTTADQETISWVDSIFDLGNSSTHLAPGNHDYSNIELLKEYTQRELSYHAYSDRLSLVLLDSQGDSCMIMDKGLEALQTAVADLSQTDFLIVMSHHLLWMYNDPYMHHMMDSVSNAKFGKCDYCIQKNNFYDTAYPLLLKAQNEGVVVLCIAGDIGFKVDEFSYVNPDGIHFLASGIDYRDSVKYALVLDHKVQAAQLRYNYVDIRELE